MNLVNRQKFNLIHVTADFIDSETNSERILRRLAAELAIEYKKQFLTLRTLRFLPQGS